MFFGPPASGDASTPQKTLLSFVKALRPRDQRTLEALVQGSKHNPALEQALDEREKPALFSVSDIALKPISPTRVTVMYVLKALPSGGAPQKTNRETLDMMKVGGKWLIVAPPISTKGAVGYLARVALVLTEPKLNKLSPEMTKAEKALWNLKDIAIGAKMYIEDDDGKILLKTADYPEALSSYIRVQNVFTSPLDKSGTISYLFNENLSGRRIDSLSSPKNTVLFFEGKPGALNFRYEGKAAVAFADGTARFVTPSDAKTLRWK